MAISNDFSVGILCVFTLMNILTNFHSLKNHLKMTQVYYQSEWKELPARHILFYYKHKWNTELAVKSVPKKTQDIIKWVATTFRSWIESRKNSSR